MFVFASIVMVLLWLGLSIWGFVVNGPAFFLPFIALSAVFLVGAFPILSAVLGAEEARKTRKRTANYSPEMKAWDKNHQAEMAAMRQAHYHDLAQSATYGPVNDALVCPHCQTKGKVHSKVGDEVSRTKVIPVVGNNIKTKREVTKMHCDNCKTDWSV